MNDCFSLSNFGAMQQMRCPCGLLQLQSPTSFVWRSARPCLPLTPREDTCAADQLPTSNQNIPRRAAAAAVVAAVAAECRSTTVPRLRYEIVVGDHFGDAAEPMSTDAHI